MNKINLVTGRAPVKLNLHSVMDVIHEIHAQGHTQQFRDAASQAGIVMSMQPKAVNFVKRYMLDQGLHTQSALLSQTVKGCPEGTPPYKCPLAPEEE